LFGRSEAFWDLTGLGRRSMKAGVRLLPRWARSYPPAGSSRFGAKAWCGHVFGDTTSHVSVVIVRIGHALGRQHRAAVLGSRPRLLTTRKMSPNQVAGKAARVSGTTPGRCSRHWKPTVHMAEQVVLWTARPGLGRRNHPGKCRGPRDAALRPYRFSGRAREYRLRRSHVICGQTLRTCAPHCVDSGFQVPPGHWWPTTNQPGRALPPVPAWVGPGKRNP